MTRRFFTAFLLSCLVLAPARAEQAPDPAKMFEVLDEDRNGALEVSEIRLLLDTPVLTEKVIEHFSKGKPAWMRRMIRKRITKRMSNGGALGKERYAQIVARFDADGDGALDHEEQMEAAAFLLGNMDRDGDGFVSLQEFRTVRKGR